MTHETGPWTDLDGVVHIGISRVTYCGETDHDPLGIPVRVCHECVMASIKAYAGGRSELPRRSPGEHVERRLTITGDLFQYTVPGGIDLNLLRRAFEGLLRLP
ncbi:hypothetical protein [Bounagaea algeriensis]